MTNLGLTSAQKAKVSLWWLGSEVSLWLGSEISLWLRSEVSLGLRFVCWIRGQSVGWLNL